jgi:hypothetical protein
MAVLAVTDAKIYIGGYNFSGYANEIGLSVVPDLLNSTTFGTGTKKNTPGLNDMSGQIKGFLDYADIDVLVPGVSLDSITFGRIGASAAVFSCAPEGNAEGDVAYGMPAVTGKITPLGGSVGQLLPWEFDVKANGVRLFRGFVAAVGSKTANGNTTVGFNLGAVGALQRLYANLHVVSAAGTTPTLNVIVESDDNSGFTTPTTRLTFAQVTTTVSAEHKSLLGPITDNWYRMKWTLTGAGATYYVFGVIAIH